MPLIGLSGWKTGDNSYGANIAYIQFLSGFGNVRILTPTEPIDDRIDLIVIPGGADVDPLRYGAIPSFYTSKPDSMKEYFDTVILPQYIKLGTPVFGICRGIQSIAVLFGAKLIQHMYHETNEKSRSEKVHSIDLLPPFKNEFMKDNPHVFSIKVNSMHHQCVSNHNFPEELEVIGVYRSKNKFDYIEVIRHRKYPIYAVQYHPEELDEDVLSDYIITELLSKSKNLKE